jgi:hypothetical protein
MPTREEYECCLRGIRERWGVEEPLPEHGLYELPVNFLDTVNREAEPTPPSMTDG